jgi:hypothetical protein
VYDDDETAAVAVASGTSENDHSTRTRQACVQWIVVSDVRAQWPLSTIRCVSSRRYLLRETAIELGFTDG